MAIADNLYIPVKDGVLQQYEGMPDQENMPVTAVMSYFPYGHTDTPENDRKTWQYYIDHSMEAYCRYPMLSGFLGIFPAWLGEDIVLPAGWSKITVGRVTIRGKSYRIEAEHGAKRARFIEPDTER